MATTYALRFLGWSPVVKPQQQLILEHKSIALTEQRLREIHKVLTLIQYCFQLERESDTRQAIRKQFTADERQLIEAKLPGCSMDH